MGSRYSAEQRERIWAEAQANLEKREQPAPVRPPHEVEDPVSKWRREADEMTERLEQERAATEDRPLLRRIMQLERELASVRAELRGEIEGSRGFVFEVVGETLGELMAQLRNEIDKTQRDEVLALRQQLSELQGVLGQLKTIIATNPDRGDNKIVDLPALPLRRVN